MQKGLTPSEKKALAFSQFMGTSQTMKQIANAVGCSEKSLRKWKEEGDWENLKTAQTLTPKKLIQQYYQQLAALNAVISQREPHLAFATTEESDRIAKIMKAISVLDKRLDLAAYAGVMEEFLNYIRSVSIGTVELFAEHLQAFMNKKARELSNEN